MKDNKDAIIERLQSAIFIMAGPHCSDGQEEDSHCIYCATKWPCITVRMARKCATLWDYDD